MVDKAGIKMLSPVLSQITVGTVVAIVKGPSINYVMLEGKGLRKCDDV